MYSLHDSSSPSQCLTRCLLAWFWIAAALQLASTTILPMLSLRLCRDTFFDGVDDDDDVSAVVASSEETAAVVSSSPGVVGVDVEPGPAYNQTFFYWCCSQTTNQ